MSIEVGDSANGPGFDKVIETFDQAVFTELPALLLGEGDEALICLDSVYRQTVETPQDELLAEQRQELDRQALVLGALSVGHSGHKIRALLEKQGYEFKPGERVVSVIETILDQVIERGRETATIAQEPIWPAASGSARSGRRTAAAKTDKTKKAPPKAQKKQSDEAMPDSVKAYLIEIGRIPLLEGHKAEAELAKRIEAGVFAQERLYRTDITLSEEEQRDLQVLAQDGQRAKNHLINANLRFVVLLAKRYQNRDMPLLDLIQEGNLGLMRAAEMFDYKKDFKFSTYSRWWIRQYISRALADKGTVIRKPVHLYEQIGKVRRIQRDLKADLAREPTTEEIAKEGGLRPEKVEELLLYARMPASLDENLPGTDQPLSEFIEDDAFESATDYVEREELRQNVRVWINQLPARQRVVVSLYYGLNGTSFSVAQIARDYDIGAATVRKDLQSARNILGENRVLRAHAELEGLGGP